MSLTALSTYAADDKAAIDQRIANAKDVLDQIMATPDKAIPNQIMSQATCVGVVPSVKKGAFLVGAEYGREWLPAPPAWRTLLRSSRLLAEALAFR